MGKSDMRKAGKKRGGAAEAVPDAAAAPRKVAKKADVKKADVKKAAVKKGGTKKAPAKKRRGVPGSGPPVAVGASSAVLDRLWGVVEARRDADPGVSHSARLMSRGTAKVAQKFGEEAVECLIEAVAGTREGLIAESADVLYHLIVMWVNAGVRSDEVWQELQRREGVSGIAEKASRAKALPLELGLGTTKIP
jgi:phosphoribosyl-ATP pyrophosphohydrolase